MKQISFLIIAFLLSNLAYSQVELVDKDPNDPRARVLLDALKSKYETFTSLEADFNLTIEFPEEDPEVQSGTLTQKGEAYKLELGNQMIMSDSETMWLYLKNRNEVQINTIDEDADSEEILNPKDLLRIYERDEFAYVLKGQVEENGVVLHQIEFKPLDRDSDYSKMRLTLNKKTREIKRIKTFSKDGSRFTLEIKDLTTNQDFADNYFVFDPGKYPNVFIEDLRD